jgi:hypothetical protein
MRTGRSSQTLGSAIYDRVLKLLPEDQSDHPSIPAFPVNATHPGRWNVSQITYED